MAYTAIIGASGYSGQETIDRVLAHPELDLFALGSDSLAGQPASSLDPRLARNGSRRAPAFVTNDEALASGADLTFICLDHERAAAIEPPARGVVVDLSGAHRLQDAALYEDWYGFSHPRAEELASWSYSIPELFPPSGRLVANPGCFAIAALLALKPLAEILDPDSVVVDGEDRDLRCGQVVEAELPREHRARERLGLPGRQAPARARDGPGARLPRVFRTPPPADPARPDHDVLRRRPTPPRRGRCSRLPT